LLHLKRKKLYIFSNFGLVLGQVRKNTLAEYPPYFICQVETNHILLQDFVVKLPPSEVNKGQEAVKKFKDEPLTQQAVVVA
jgi:hypothetical protein